MWVFKYNEQVWRGWFSCVVLERLPYDGPAGHSRCGPASWVSGFSGSLKFPESFVSETVFTCSTTRTCLFCYQTCNMQLFTFCYTVTPTRSRHCLLACAFPFLLASLCPRGEWSPKNRVLKNRVCREPGDTWRVQLLLQVEDTVPSQTEAPAHWQVPFRRRRRSTRPPWASCAQTCSWSTASTWRSWSGNSKRRKRRTSLR